MSPWEVAAVVLAVLHAVEQHLDYRSTVAFRLLGVREGNPLLDNELNEPLDVVKERLAPLKFLLALLGALPALVVVAAERRWDIPHLGVQPSWLVVPIVVGMVALVAWYAYVINHNYNQGKRAVEKPRLADLPSSCSEEN